MSRSLRHLTKVRLTPSQTMKVIGRFKDMDDRTCAIVMCAMLDHSLETLLLLHMKSLSKDERDRLFFGLGPLASFSAKIKIGAAFGIIGPKTVKDMETLNEIRNVFGHAAQGITFRNRAIRDRLNQMHVQEAIGVFFKVFKSDAIRTLGSARGLYFLSAWVYMDQMTNVIKGPKPVRLKQAIWPAPGSADTELGVFMGPEVSHGETEVYTRVQA
jgi:hypothetical protein